MKYVAYSKRYNDMKYVRCGKSGLKLPQLSLGLWQNFGDVDDFAKSERIILKAFDSGITYIDLANNYGPPPGSAEVNFGKIFHANLRSYRDEMIIASKAGYTMWDGPYGDWGSRKYLVASCDQSLKRTGLDYFDIFYSHRYDPETPLEETMGALDYIVRSGRALYVALSRYPADKFIEAISILRSLGTPCIAHQLKYSMLTREFADPLFGVHEKEGIGCVSFSPLEQGLLSDKYLDGVPEYSRGSKSGSSLNIELINSSIQKVRALNLIATQREQSLAQMAIAWQLYDGRVTSVLVGVSSEKQLDDNLAALKNTIFSLDELSAINKIIGVKL